jgi:hypothetical protein
MTKLHKDWPEFEIGGPLSDPMYDLDTALDEGEQKFAHAQPTPVNPRISLADVEKVTDYDISYGGIEWTPESSYGGTELEMLVIGKLRDGRWFYVSAGNDYTGWGCQDYSDVRVARTRKQLVEQALTDSDRRALGIK